MDTKTNRSTRRTGVVTGTAILLSALMLAGCSVTSSSGGTAPSASAQDIPAGDGPGVSADSITVVWDTLAGTQDDPASQGDMLAAKKAIVDELNRQGGILGRKVIVPDIYPADALKRQRLQAFDAAGGLDIGGDAMAAETCKAIQESGTFFAQIGQELISKPLSVSGAAACLNQAGRVIVAAPSTWTAADFAAAPFTAGIGVRAERLTDALVVAAGDAGIAKDSSLTLLAETTTQQAVVDRYRSAFQSAGYTKVSVTSIAPDISPADALNVVVKLRDEGVQSIAFVSATAFGTSMGTVVDVLGQQNFAPKLLDVNVDIASMVTTAPTDEVAAALHFYTTKRDYFQPTPAQAAETDATPAGALCAAALKEFSPGTRNDVLSLCDGLTFLKAALEAGDSSHGLNAKTFASGVASLKDSYRSPSAFATSFSDTQHDGAAAITKFIYDPVANRSNPDGAPVKF